MWTVLLVPEIRVKYCPMSANFDNYVTGVWMLVNPLWLLFNTEVIKLADRGKYSSLQVSLILQVVPVLLCTVCTYQFLSYS